VAKVLDQTKVAHLRFGGRSIDVPLDGLGLTEASRERDIKATLAEFLEVKSSELDAYVVDRHPNGNITLRPEAVFG
jgi:hypothetical protein